MAIKPSSHIDWTDGDAAKQVEPSAGKKLLGWVALERPPFEFMNHLFFRLDEWQKYFEEVTDAQIASLLVIVDSDPLKGNFTALQAAHDDAGTVAGSKIVITSDLVLTATVSITKPDIEIEMRNSKRFVKDAGAGAGFVGMQITATADRVRLKHCGFGKAGVEFDGAGDIALEILAGAEDVYLDNPIFGPGNTQDLEDNANNTLVINSPMNVLV